jgi:hypothetical protein
LAQGENLQTEIVTCAKERAQVGEEREHAVLTVADSAPAGSFSIRIRSVNPCAAQPRARAAAHWSGNNSASRFCG